MVCDPVSRTDSEGKTDSFESVSCSTGSRSPRIGRVGKPGPTEVRGVPGVVPHTPYVHGSCGRSWNLGEKRGQGRLNTDGGRERRQWAERYREHNDMTLRRERRTDTPSVPLRCPYSFYVQPEGRGSE